MIYHISHIDLDGFGCQYITSKVFKDIKYINANYNKSIEDTLSNLFLELSKNPEEAEILVTDINLPIELSDRLNNFSKQFNIKVTLLDHHSTGIDSASKYDWYHLSEDVCATKLTYQFFYDILEKKLTPQELQIVDDIVEAVNAYDLWMEDSDVFPRGRLLNTLILESRNRFSKLIEGEAHSYLEHIFDGIGKLFKTHSVAEIEKEFYDISKGYLKDKILNEYFENKNHTLDFLFHRFVYETTKDYPFPFIEIGGFKGKLFSDMGGGLFQDFSNFFLHESDIDFVAHFSDRGSMSFRSKNKVDVAQLAAEYFGGGGHPNAAGASLGERLSNVKVDEALKLIEKAKTKKNAKNN